MRLSLLLASLLILVVVNRGQTQPEIVPEQKVDGAEGNGQGVVVHMVRIIHFKPAAIMGRKFGPFPVESEAEEGEEDDDVGMMAPFEHHKMMMMKKIGEMMNSKQKIGCKGLMKGMGSKEPMETEEKGFEVVESTVDEKADEFEPHHRPHHEHPDGPFEPHHRPHHEHPDGPFEPHHRPHHEHPDGPFEPHHRPHHWWHPGCHHWWHPHQDFEPHRHHGHHYRHHRHHHHHREWADKFKEFFANGLEDANMPVFNEDGSVNRDAMVFVVLLVACITVWSLLFVQCVRFYFRHFWYSHNEESYMPLPVQESDYGAESETLKKGIPVASDYVVSDGKQQFVMLRLA